MGVTALRTRSLTAASMALLALAGCSKVKEQTVASAGRTTTTSKASSRDFSQTELTTSPTTAGSGGAVPTTTPYRPAKARVRLVTYKTCGTGLDDIKTEALRIVTPYGLPQSYGRDVVATGGAERQAAPTDSAAGSTGGSAPPAPTSSGTNVQEAGVDEPDIVKSDGRRMVTAIDGTFRVLDVADGRPRLTGSLAMADAYGASILLVGDRALVFTTEYPNRPQPQPDAGGASFAPYPSDPPRTIVRVVDVTGPRVVNTMSLEGSMVDARLVGGVARVVLNSNSQGPRMVQPTEPGPEAENAALQENKRRISASTLGDWIPDYTASPVGGEARSGTLSTCSHVHHPDGEQSGMGMMSVVAVDPADPAPRPGETVVGGGQVIYGSASSIYVTTAAYSPDSRASGTRIHRFDITDPRQSRYKGSGSVPGWVRSQWSMSEHASHLRVASTRWGTEPGPDGRTSSDSSVTVLRIGADDLSTVGSVAGLGPGEQIQGVRMMGDRGYVVTFRQTDPLYVIDLSDPRRPKVLGELKVLGFSSYLHPVSEHRLIGVGADADSDGRRTGVKVALYDVADPAAPRQLDTWTIADRYSVVEGTHHGFLWWSPKALAVVPTTGAFATVQPRPADDGGGGTAPPEEKRVTDEAIGLRVAGDELVETGRITHMERAARPEMATIQRSLVVDGAVLTVSAAGVMSSELDGFATRAWADFSG